MTDRGRTAISYGSHARLFHLCIGCSDGRLSDIAPAMRRIMLPGICHVAEYVPTIFLLEKEQSLAAELAPMALPQAISYARGERVLISDGEILKGFRKIGEDDVVLLSGIHMSREIFTTAIDLMERRRCKTVIIREAVSDAHKQAENAAIAMLQQAYSDRFSVVRIDRCADLLATAAIADVEYSWRAIGTYVDVDMAVNSNVRLAETA